MSIYSAVIPFKQQAVAATFLPYFPYRIPLLLLFLLSCLIFVTNLSPQHIFYPHYTDRYKPVVSHQQFHCYLTNSLSPTIHQLPLYVLYKLSYKLVVWVAHYWSSPKWKI